LLRVGHDAAVGSGDPGARARRHASGREERPDPRQRQRWHPRSPRDADRQPSCEAAMSNRAIRDDRSAEFFDALAGGRLQIRRCVPHGHVSSPEVMFCAECGSRALEWAPTQGSGTVVSWTAIHGRPDETGATTVTAYVGLVELAEGPWLLARLLVDDVT